MLFFPHGIIVVECDSPGLAIGPLKLTRIRTTTHYVLNLLFEADFICVFITCKYEASYHYFAVVLARKNEMHDVSASAAPGGQIVDSSHCQVFSFPKFKTWYAVVDYDLLREASPQIYKNTIAEVRVWVGRLEKAQRAAGDALDLLNTPCSRFIIKKKIVLAELESGTTQNVKRHHR